jgi:hypothetical protein
MLQKAMIVLAATLWSIVPQAASAGYQAFTCHPICPLIQSCCRQTPAVWSKAFSFLMVPT